MGGRREGVGLTFMSEWQAASTQRAGPHTSDDGVMLSSTRDSSCPCGSVLALSVVGG
jgi:hypothetical protein